MSTLPYSDVRAERKKQDEQWGGPEHDDQHEVIDWLDYIDYQTTRATPGPAVTTAVARQRFVKIAALAIAAVESIDRKAGRS